MKVSLVILCSLVAGGGFGVADARVVTSKNRLIAGPEVSAGSSDFTVMPVDSPFKRRKKSVDEHDADVIASKSNDQDDGEMMQTAEMYFRPLSRYRELQRKRNHTVHTDETVAAGSSHFESTSRFSFGNRGGGGGGSRRYDTTLQSKNPEFCLPAKGGVVCFYKV